MMARRVRVIGLGQALAGDDAAGLVVVELLQRRGPWPGVELSRLSDASQLVEQLCDVDAVWIVDAVSTSPAGSVLELELSQLDARASCSASSHGLDVAQAIQLCRELYPARCAAELHVLGISIDTARLERRASGLDAASLSPNVASATQQAAERIARALAEAPPRLIRREDEHARE